jgi:TRAP-type C4-dicarboxylate transport system permease small subunit
MTQHLTDPVDRVLRWLLISLMSLMVATVTWQVITRYLLQTPSSYTAEMSTFLLIWISLLGGAYALRLRAHLGIDLISSRLSRKADVSITVVAHAAVIVFAALVLVYGGGRLVYVTLVLNQLSAAFQLPMGYVYLAVPISGLLMIYYSVIAIIADREEPMFLKESVADPEIEIEDTRS